MVYTCVNTAIEYDQMPLSGLPCRERARAAAARGRAGTKSGVCSSRLVMAWLSLVLVQIRFFFISGSAAKAVGRDLILVPPVRLAGILFSEGEISLVGS